MFQLHRFYCVIVILNYMISSQQYKVVGVFLNNLIVVLKIWSAQTKLRQGSGLGLACPAWPTGPEWPSAEVWIRLCRVRAVSLGLLRGTVGVALVPQGWWERALGSWVVASCAVLVPLADTTSRLLSLLARPGFIVLPNSPPCEKRKREEKKKS